MKNIENITEAIETQRLFREKLLADSYRPGYHFAIPEDIGIPGDPNGAFYANGRYHLMYLYNCRSDSFRWGHISSLDLIHWRCHPDSILPDHLDAGIYSGGAFVDNDGAAYMCYWSLPVPGSAGGIRIVKSNDPLYENWEKYAEYAIRADECGITYNKQDDGTIDYLACADPSNIWLKDGKYYMQTGNLAVLLKFRETGLEAPENVKGDWTDLFESTDMVNWKHLHRFYERNALNTWTAEDEDDMCPSFLPLPKSKSGGEMSDKYLQLFISHNRGCQYYIGEYDTKNDRFIPEKHGRMTWLDNTYFAPESLLDHKGRQIMWVWLYDNIEDELSRGWSGVFGLPRLLWLNENGELGIAPIEELKMLRYNEKSFENVLLDSNNRYQLKGINGESCEIKLSINTKNAKKAGIIVRASHDESEATYIYFDADKKRLVLDTLRGSVMGRPFKEEAPFVLENGETLELTIYIDKSVIEVFANERQAMARRAYTKSTDSQEIKVFCENGEVSFDEITAWEMMPSNMF